MSQARNLPTQAPGWLIAACLLALGLPSPAPAQSSQVGPGNAARPDSSPADTRPERLRDVGFDQRIGERVPAELAFRDADGQVVELGDLYGERPLVLSLVYFDCPMLCPLTLNALTASLKALPFELGEAYDAVVVSFDPREGPEAATLARQRAFNRYGRTGTEDGWHFLTGDPESIDRLAEAVGFRYTWDEERREFAHGAGVVVLTPGGQIARYFFGIEYPPKDLKLGLVEAGQGRLGSVIDQVLLTCYQYDPETGQYAWSARAMSALRLAAVATVLILIGFIVFSVRRDRTAHHDTRTV